MEISDEQLRDLAKRFYVEGYPLEKLGLENAYVVDADGNEVGKFEGFVIVPGKTILESIQESLAPGHTLTIKPHPQ